jgi:hypothetical protein
MSVTSSIDGEINDTCKILVEIIDGKSPLKRQA